MDRAYWWDVRSKYSPTASRSPSAPCDHRTSGMALRRASEPAFEAGTRLLMREGPAFRFLPEPALDLLDDVEFVLDVLERGVVVEPVNETTGGLLRTRRGHGSSGRTAHDTADAHGRCRRAAAHRQSTALVSGGVGAPAEVEHGAHRAGLHRGTHARGRRRAGRAVQGGASGGRVTDGR